MFSLTAAEDHCSASPETARSQILKPATLNLMDLGGQEFLVSRLAMG